MPEVKLRGDLAVVVSTELLQKAANLAVLMILARHLAADDLGRLFLALMVTSVVGLLSMFGTNPFLTRAVAASPPNALSLLSEVFSARLPLIGATFVILNGSVFFFWPDLGPLFLLASFYGVWGDLYFTFAAFFIGKRRFGLRLVTGLVGPVVLIPLVVLASARGTGLLGVMGCYVLARAAMLLAGWLVVRIRFGRLILRFDRDASARVLAASWPFMLIAAVSLIQFKVDSVMLFAFLGAEAVASYETAYKVLEVSRLLIRPMTIVFFPVCAALAAAGDWSRFAVASRRLLSVSMATALLVIVVGMPAASFLMKTIWGEAYASANVLRTLLLATPPLFVGVVLSSLAVSMHLERPTVILLSMTLVFNVVANTFAIPVWGEIGAAGTTVITETLFAAVLGMVLWRKLRGRTRVGVGAGLSA